MKVEISEDGELVLKEVFNSICLETSDGERMAISMRDSGFEFCYQGIWYSAKKSVVSEIYPTTS